MTLEEYIIKYDELSIKEMTKTYNEFSVTERLDFLDALSETNREKFIEDIREQAVDDFWVHERQAILEGKCTRDWTPEQIEKIMALSNKTGKMSTNAGKTQQLDANGEPRLNKNGKEIVYQGHHMLNVNEYPECAADWRNI